MGGAVFADPAALLAASAGALGSSEWLKIDQTRINLFAEATGDHQWIHIDPERAGTGPFGACIAHGYLTLSLVNYFLPQLCRVDAFSMGVNYGCNRVRFPGPVRVDSRVRGNGELLETEETRDGGVQAIIRVSVEVEGADRPGCVADTISRFYP